MSSVHGVCVAVISRGVGQWILCVYRVLCLYFLWWGFSRGVRHFLVGDWCKWWWVDSSVGLLLSGVVLFYLWCSALL